MKLLSWPKTNDRGLSGGAGGILLWKFPDTQHHKLTPVSLDCFNPLKEGGWLRDLNLLFSSPGFLSDCNEWSEISARSRDYGRQGI